MLKSRLIFRMYLPYSLCLLTPSYNFTNSWDLGVICYSSLLSVCRLDGLIDRQVEMICGKKAYKPINEPLTDSYSILSLINSY